MSFVKAGEKVGTERMKTKTAYRLNMAFRGAVVTAATLLCCLITLTDAMGQGNRAVSFDDLLNGIKNSEKKLLNLRVEGKCLFLDWDAGKQDWQYGGESHVTAWYTGVPGSKLRFDIHKQIRKWINGPAPFSNSSGTIAYNGRVGQYLLLEEGTPVKPVKTLFGQITAGREDLGIDYEASGWTRSLYGCEEEENKMRFSEFLEKVQEVGKPQKSVQYSVNPVRFSNTDCIELVVQVTPPKGNPQKEIWYFDPSRGYAILFHEDTATSAQETVEKLAEPAPGVFYPVKATRLIKDTSGQPAYKWVYEASSVVANDPNFSDDIFTIEWPEGTVVEDKISGTTFTVGASASDTEKRIRDQVKEVKKEVANPPGPQTEKTNSRRGYWMVAAIIVVAGVLTLLLLFVTKGPRK